MPKMKTHKGAAKRFRITRKGKVVGAHSSRSHKLEKKGSGRRQDLRKALVLSDPDATRVKRLVPYKKG